MSLDKKLKRGLQDLSPLFQQDPSPSSPQQAVSGRAMLPSVFSEVQFLAVGVPDHEGDAFLANAYLASQLVRRTPLFASLVSIAPGLHTPAAKVAHPFPSLELLHPRISRVVLSHQSLWSLTQSKSQGKPPVVTGSPEGIPQLIFLDFEPSQFRSLRRIAVLVDRLILFIDPQPDSLREAYRMTKIFWHLNPEIEFFLLFRGPAASPKQGEYFFERFSLITSRFLGVSTQWLGDLAFPEKKEARWNAAEAEIGFNPGPVLAGDGLRRPLLPEKAKFWAWFRGILRDQKMDERTHAVSWSSF